jgi:MFS superfamily sulfate permease-like transporter
MRAWIDMTLMNLTFFLTIIWSVQVGVTVSLIISLLLVVRRSSKTRMAILVGVSSIEQDVCFV